MKKPKLAFVWFWDQASSVFPNWRDGLRGALDLVGREYDISWFFDKTIPLESDGFDFILFWDDSNSAFFNEIDKYSCRKGICLTTAPQNVENLKRLDVVFCESQPIYEAVRAAGVRAIKAFGTDTEFFKPDPKVKKDIEYFYPATFSPWKRQRDISYLGSRLLCVGTVQPDGAVDYNSAIENGVQIELGYFPAEKIRDYYRRSKKVIIPAIHGSERTVLEAMAMNILPEVVGNNPRSKTYLEEFKNSGSRTTRDFIVNNYSHFIYADKLLKGINED